MAFFDDLREHPDTLILEVAGKDVPFLLTKAALSEAKDEGVDLADFRGLEEDDVHGNLDALSTLLWIGTLPFEEDTPTKEDFDAVLTPRVAAQVGPQVMAQFEGIADEEIEEVTSGK